MGPHLDARKDCRRLVVRHLNYSGRFESLRLHDRQDFDLITVLKSAWIELRLRRFLDVLFLVYRSPLVLVCQDSLGHSVLRKGLC